MRICMQLLIFDSLQKVLQNNSRLSMALGTHPLARDAESWGVRGIFKVRKYSPALLTFRTLQNFAHTILFFVSGIDWSIQAHTQSRALPPD